MTEPSELFVSGGAEGLLDEAVLTRLIRHSGAEPGPIHGGNGKQYLLRQLAGYNMAARHSPWVVMVDLNGDESCAPPAREKWLPNVAPMMCFRIVVRAVESWLLSDANRIASFLSVADSRIPRSPEDLENRKATMVQIASRSRRREIREDMVPRPAAGRSVGPAYTSRLIEFATDDRVGWRPKIAANSSDSLTRSLLCLRRLIGEISSKEISASLTGIGRGAHNN